MRVSYHDDTGVTFDAVGETSVSVRPSRFDSNTVTNSTATSFDIECVKETFTVVKATRTLADAGGKTKTLVDFAVFDVKRAVTPMSLPGVVSVGDVLKLRPLVEAVGAGIKTDEPGWKSEPEGIFRAGMITN